MVDETPVESVQYRVRKGYVWVGPDGKGQPGLSIVTPDMPGFKGQRFKLEPVIPGTPMAATEDRKIGAGESEGR